MRVLYDTDFLINLFVNSEPNHKIASNIQSNLDKSNRHHYSCLKLVTYELATVLSRKFEAKITLNTLSIFNNQAVELISLSEAQEKKVWDLFKSYSKKNISFIDCANLVIAQEYNLKIASFDKFYPKESLIISTKKPLLTL